MYKYLRVGTCPKCGAPVLAEQTFGTVEPETAADGNKCLKGIIYACECRLVPAPQPILQPIYPYLQPPAQPQPIPSYNPDLFPWWQPTWIGDFPVPYTTTYYDADGRPRNPGFGKI